MKTCNLMQRSSRACLALAAAAGLLGAGATLAADRSMTIHYSDVNLATISGAATLYRRIQGAARLVCGERGRSLVEQRDWQVCYHAAIDDAVATVNSPTLTAVHRSREAPATAMR
jgi:UrcA family protein